MWCQFLKTINPVDGSRERHIARFPTAMFVMVIIEAHPDNPTTKQVKCTVFGRSGMHIVIQLCDIDRILDISQPLLASYLHI